MTFGAGLLRFTFRVLGLFQEGRLEVIRSNVTAEKLGVAGMGGKGFVV